MAVVSSADLVFERTIELPPVIVWDALVDLDLLAGWLGEVRLHPTDPAAFILFWSAADASPETRGTVTSFRPARQLAVDTNNRGSVEFLLSPVPGGLRGTSTDLVLRVNLGVEPAFAGRAREAWETNLDRLLEVLSGRPVDWEHARRAQVLKPGQDGLSGSARRPG